MNFDLHRIGREAHVVRPSRTLTRGVPRDAGSYATHTVDTSGMSASEKAAHMKSKVHGTYSTVVEAGKARKGDVTTNEGNGTYTIADPTTGAAHIGATAAVSSTTYHAG